MDPYLEDPGLWPDVHSRLINVSSEMLLAQLRPRYFVQIEERVYLADESLEIHEGRLAVMDRALQRVVTVIEILSPANKVKGSVGKNTYDEKKREILSSDTNLVEIDLLRAGAPLYRSSEVNEADYMAQVWRWNGRRHRRFIWPMKLRDRLPSIPVPVRLGDEDAALDIQAAVNTVYERAGYDLGIDYAKRPIPPLAGDLEQWAQECVATLKR
jgi:hypothetical protein